MSRYNEWCPTCQAPITTVTRGIPSMGICQNGHKTDRRDALRREPQKGTTAIKLRLEKRDDGAWQADAILPDGSDFHAIGHEPWKALIELGIYWARQPKPNDLSDLARVLVENRKEHEQ